MVLASRRRTMTMTIDDVYLTMDDGLDGAMDDMVDE
jgi:hypothetical protein